MSRPNAIALWVAVPIRALGLVAIEVNTISHPVLILSVSGCIFLQEYGFLRLTSS